MPRPHYKKGDDTARDKLEAAFWDALAEGSYEGISVVGLCRSAGVNKNTFYYHFDNIDELARAAAESLVETQFIYTVIEAIRGDAQLPDYLSKSEFSTRLNRVCLLADDRAPSQLRRMLHDAILRMWSAKLALTWTDSIFETVRLWSSSSADFWESSYTGAARAGAST